MGLGFSPIAQISISLFLSQFRYVQYSLQHADDDVATILDSSFDVGIASSYAGRTNYLLLCIQIGVYGLGLLLSFLICKDGSNIPQEPQEIQPEKDDFQVPTEVKEETERVDACINGEGDASDELILVHNLVKRYYTAPSPNAENINVEHRPTIEDEEGLLEENKEEQKNQQVGFNAVKGTSFGVKRGEVFSLLGVNGAGKSSTFNCMVGSQRCSGGTILLDGVNADNYVGNPAALAGILGYCPQTNIFDSALTVVQSLTLIARLAGIDEHQRQQYVTSSIWRFGLNAFIDTKAGNLSGGNMRKLSLAMAMIGQPKIVFIDEASTGVDPSSRRTMWKAIRHEGKNSAVILTTHAMEEAEAISSKIAI